MSFLKWFVRTYPFNENFKKFIDFSWNELVDLIHDQALRNRFLQETSTQRSKDQPLNRHLDRRYNQLPCTQKTAINRVREAKKICHLDSPILLLGDDDFVGIELMRAGFTDVTSVDIDPVVCRQLQEIADNENLPLRVVEHDIQQLPAQEHKRGYRLIFADPMYSLNGVDLFLRAGERWSKEGGSSYYFLSLHLMSLKTDGILQLAQYLNNNNFRVCDVQTGFNVYPVPLVLHNIIRIFNKKFMKSNILSEQNYMFRYFLSDALLLQKMEP